MEPKWATPSFQVWQESRKVLAEVENRLADAMADYAAGQGTYPSDLLAQVVEVRSRTDKLLDRVCTELQARSRRVARTG